MLLCVRIYRRRYCVWTAMIPLNIDLSTCLLKFTLYGYWDIRLLWSHIDRPKYMILFLYLSLSLSIIYIIIYFRVRCRRKNEFVKATMCFLNNIYFWSLKKRRPKISSLLLLYAPRLYNIIILYTNTIMRCNSVIIIILWSLPPPRVYYINIIYRCTI